MVETTAYIADGDGLRIVDVSDPNTPNEIGFYGTPGDARNVAVSCNIAHVADGAGGLRIADISDPEQPVEAGFYDTPGDARNVEVVGNTVYVADGDGGLIILRFSPCRLYLPLVLSAAEGLVLSQALP